MSTNLDSPIYDDLKAASPEELLLAAAHFYEQYGASFAKGLRCAVKIIGPDGWMQVAPVWLREYRDRPQGLP